MQNFGWSLEVYYEGVKNIMYINVKTPDKYSFNWSIFLINAHLQMFCFRIGVYFWYMQIHSSETANIYFVHAKPNSTNEFFTMYAVIITSYFLSKDVLQSL